MSEKPAYWFEAKRYGWGWTWPATWQGWAVVLVYAVLFVGGMLYVPGEYRVIYVLAITAVLVAVAVWKGERPVRWRWGRRGAAHD